MLSGPRRGIDGSLGVMMASPVFADPMQKAIAYARFAGRDGYSTVPPKLTELAIIMGARAWTAQYAWYVHRRAAVTAGLSEPIVAAVRDGKRPAAMQKDEEAVYDFCNELLTTRQVSDATFQAARTVLGGDRGVVDLIGTLGAYQVVRYALRETPDAVVDLRRRERAKRQPQEALAAAVRKEREAVGEVQSSCRRLRPHRARQHTVRQRERDENPPSGRVGTASGMYVASPARHASRRGP